MASDSITKLVGRPLHHYLKAEIQLLKWKGSKKKKEKKKKKRKKKASQKDSSTNLVVTLLNSNVRYCLNSIKQKVKYSQHLNSCN